MKPDTERKNYYNAPLHVRRKNLNIHLSKDLRSSMNSPKRALLVRKGDKVKVMRGKWKGKEATVARVSVSERKVYLEGISSRSARGREVLVAFQPSNLMLVSVEKTKEREKLFKSDVFKQSKKESKKEQKVKSSKKEDYVKEEDSKPVKKGESTKDSSKVTKPEKKEKSTEKVVKKEKESKKDNKKGDE